MNLEQLISNFATGM